MRSALIVIRELVATNSVVASIIASVVFFVLYWLTLIPGDTSIGRAALQSFIGSVIFFVIFLVGNILLRRRHTNR